MLIIYICVSLRSLNLPIYLSISLPSSLPHSLSFSLSLSHHIFAEGVRPTAIAAPHRRQPKQQRLHPQQRRPASPPQRQPGHQHQRRLRLCTAELQAPAPVNLHPGGAREGCAGQGILSPCTPCLFVPFLIETYLFNFFWLSSLSILFE